MTEVLIQLHRVSGIATSISERTVECIRLMIILGLS